MTGKQVPTTTDYAIRAQVIDELCFIYYTSPKDIIASGYTRVPSVTKVRQLAYYILSVEFNMTVMIVSRLFKRSHGAIIPAIRFFEEERDKPHIDVIVNTVAENTKRKLNYDHILTCLPSPNNNPVIGNSSSK